MHNALYFDTETKTVKDSQPIVFDVCEQPKKIMRAGGERRTRFEKRSVFHRGKRSIFFNIADIT